MPIPAPTTTRRVLVVVDDVCTAPGLCSSAVRSENGAPVEALVIVPAGTPAARWYVDDDAARADAVHRLRTCVDRLEREGIRVTGALGDADPIEAITDALHEFEADEILLVAAPQRPSGRLRQKVVDRARQVFHQPITHVSTPG